jgi:hypothetical protein
VRRRDRAELAALLHALHLYGEPCEWCGAAATAPWEDERYTAEVLQCSPRPAGEGSLPPAGDERRTAEILQCSRCGWEISTSRQTMGDTADGTTPG